MKIITNSLYSIEREFPIGTVVSNSDRISGTVIGYYACSRPEAKRCSDCQTDFTCGRVKTGPSTTGWCWSLYSSSIPLNQFNGRINNENY